MTEPVPRVDRQFVMGGMTSLRAARAMGDAERTGGALMSLMGPQQGREIDRDAGGPELPR